MGMTVVQSQPFLVLYVNVLYYNYEYHDFVHFPFCLNKPSSVIFIESAEQFLTVDSKCLFH